MFALFSHTLLTGIVITLLLFSIICQIIIGVLYQNMIKEADNMSATENKILKQCKVKFSNCYQLNLGVNNIGIFVDKYLNKIKIAGLSVNGIGHFAGQLMLLSVFISGIGICKGIVEGKTLGELLPYYIISLFGLYVYFSVSSLVDINGKKAILKTNLMDYLENSMVSRLNFTLTDEVASNEAKPERKLELLEQSNTEEIGKKQAKKRPEPEFNKKEADELEQLLEKLLV